MELKKDYLRTGLTSVSCKEFKMDLTIPVVLKNNPMSFGEYCSTIKKEELSSLAYLKDPASQWHVPDSLRAKVNQDGKLKPFFGDTVVLPLEVKDFSLITPFIREIYYNNTGNIFAEPLLEEHFHVTLHDLSNSPVEAEIKDIVSENEKKCIDLFKKIAAYLKKNPGMSKVRITSVYPFPSCNISVILGFAPESDLDYRIIMNLYNLFDDVVYLNYWLRLHITLAYFKPDDIKKDEMIKLCRVLEESGKNKILLELDLWKLSYQRFLNMNDYRTVFTVKHFY